MAPKFSTNPELATTVVDVRTAANRQKGKRMMQAAIKAVTSGLPVALTQIRQLGPTLEQ